MCVPVKGEGVTITDTPRFSVGQKVRHTEDGSEAAIESIAYDRNERVLYFVNFDGTPFGGDYYVANQLEPVE